MRPYYQHTGYGGGGHHYLTPAVKWLIIANIAVFFIQVISVSIFQSPWFHNFFALYPIKVIENFWIWQLLTYSFLHDVRSIFHILFNLVTLYFLGHLVERAYGTQKFFICYFFAAIFSALVHCIIHYTKGTTIPTVGASGAILGILMVASCIAPRATIFFNFIIPMQMRTLIWIIIGVNIYTALMSPNGPIAAIVHLGGLAAGYLFYKYQDVVLNYFDQLERKMTVQYERKKRKNTKDYRAEVDRLLDKINEQGIQSLTEKEKRFLKEVSNKYR